MKMGDKKHYDAPTMERWELYPDRELTALDVAEENGDMPAVQGLSGSWSPWV